MPELTPHDLRHAHATILLNLGVPVKVVSERLGHSSPAFTMTVYQHVLPGMQAEAAATFAALLGEGEKDGKELTEERSMRTRMTERTLRAARKRISA